MTPVIQSSLKKMESLKNGLQPHSQVTPLFPMGAVLLSSPLDTAFDADAKCKGLFTRSDAVTVSDKQGVYMQCLSHRFRHRFSMFTCPK